MKYIYDSISNALSLTLSHYGRDFIGLSEFQLFLNV